MSVLGIQYSHTMSVESEQDISVAAYVQSLYMQVARSLNMPEFIGVLGFHVQSVLVCAYIYVSRLVLADGKRGHLHRFVAKVVGALVALQCHQSLVFRQKP